jgi:hypothetical protein
MKKNLLFAISIAALGVLFSTFVFAQDDKTVSAAGELYVISAKAGGVNYVEGKVSVARKDGKSGLLLKDDKLEIGDKISTGADGKVEILLNPGSFARLGENSTFEFASTNLENLKLKLLSGSAIFEVYADDEFKVSVELPKAAVELTKSGVYRVDVLPEGNGKISVWKGKVILNDEAEVKGGKSAIINGKQATIAKFDRDNKDALDIWSQLRAKESAKINARLQQGRLSSTLLNSFNRGGWNMYNTFGLWVFDRFTGRWCFLPFGSGWGSPYGYDYGFSMWDCRMPQYVYTPPTNPVNPTNPGNSITPAQAQINRERSENSRTPTFQRFENNQRTESRGDSNTDNNGNTQRDNGNWNNNRRTENDSRPTYTPSTPSTPTRETPPIIAPRTEKDNKDN